MLAAPYLAQPQNGEQLAGRHHRLVVHAALAIPAAHTGRILDPAVRIHIYIEICIMSICVFVPLHTLSCLPQGYICLHNIRGELSGNSGVQLHIHKLVSDITKRNR